MQTSKSRLLPKEIADQSNSENDPNNNQREENRNFISGQQQQQQQNNSNNFPVRFPQKRNSNGSGVLFYTTAPLLSVANDRRTEFQQNCSFIILLSVNFLERFAYYGLLCNYVLYLNMQPLYWESYNASFMLLIFLGITHVSSVIGGWIADAWLGKYLTICMSFIIYICGYVAFPLMAFDRKHVPSYCQAVNTTTMGTDGQSLKALIISRSVLQESCSWVVILNAILCGLAVGFLKANLGPFGADQVLSRGQTMVFKYFNWLYWCTNLGSLASFAGLAYVQQNESFFIGFLIPLVSLVISFFLFLIGNFFYIKRSSEMSVLSNIYRVIVEAFKSARRQQNSLRQKQRERALLAEDEGEEEDYSETASLADSYYNDLNSNSIQNQPESWLDNAKIRYGGSFDDNLVEDVKSLRKIICLFAILIPYWTVYFQIETTFIVQGLHMKLFSRSSDKASAFMIPAAWLSIADQVCVLIMIPLMNSFVYPLIKNKFNKIPSEGTRVVIGMSFSAFSVITAGIIESIRWNIIQSDPIDNTLTQVIDNTTFYAANFHIAWQIPQYTFMGFGEVFCSVACLYYAYSAAPKSMQSIIMGIFYVFTGLGSFLGSLILYTFRKYIYSADVEDNINCPQCHLNYYFYFLAILQIIGMFAFIFMDSKYGITTMSKIDRQEVTQTANTTPKSTLIAPNTVRNALKKSTLNNTTATTRSSNYNSIDSVVRT